MVGISVRYKDSSRPTSFGGHDHSVSWQLTMVMVVRDDDGGFFEFSILIAIQRFVGLGKGESRGREGLA